MNFLIICPNCAEKNEYSSIDSSIDQKGNIFFMCPSCKVESADILWQEFNDKIEISDKKTNRIILRISTCETKDGSIHFSPYKGKKTFCGKKAFKSVDSISINAVKICTDCMSDICSMMGIPEESVKFLLGIKGMKDG